MPYECAANNSNGETPVQIHHVVAGAWTLGLVVALRSYVIWESAQLQPSRLAQWFLCPQPMCHFLLREMPEGDPMEEDRALYLTIYFNRWPRREWL